MTGSGTGGLVAIENSTPEVIHVVNVSSPQQRSSRQIAPVVESSNMQTITISAANLNFPLNLVCNSLQQLVTFHGKSKNINTELCREY